MKHPEQAQLLKLSVQKLSKQRLREELQSQQQRLLTLSQDALNFVFAHSKNQKEVQNKWER